MMPDPNATWADAKKSFMFQKSIGNLRGGRYMGLTEEQIMAKPSEKLILERRPGFKDSENYISRPLYIAYSPNENGIEMVRGLISCDTLHFYFSVDGKWKSTVEQDIPAEILESTVCRVPDSRRRNTVSTHKFEASFGPDLLVHLTLAELKEERGPHEKDLNYVQSFATLLAAVSLPQPPAGLDA